MIKKYHQLVRLKFRLRYTDFRLIAKYLYTFSIRPSNIIVMDFS